MGLFSSSSSSSGGDTTASASASTSTLPTRSARQECWVARDTYFECLTSNSITVPPGTDMADGRAPSTKNLSAEQKAALANKERKLGEARDNDPCQKLRGDYEGHCAKSWVDYFNKRRVLEERQRLMYAQGKAPIGSGPAPGAN